jgi:hypothetical protein
MNNMEHRVQYLKDANGHYVGCIAIKEHATAPGERFTLVEYRLSVLNPDDSFDKDVARQLALGRMVEAPYTVRTAAHPNLHEVSTSIMKDIVRDVNAPSRAKRAARLWLRRGR